MATAEILTRLKALSNEKTMALYTKKGAGDNQFGVKLGDIRKLANEIKTNQQLALELWKTKNIDARLLACLILNPKELTAKDLEQMAISIDFVQVADWFSAYILKDHPAKEQLRERWLESDHVWLARFGWGLTAGKIARGAEALDLNKLLNRLEKEMPEAPAEVQWTMNTALAYIGIYHPVYRERAIDLGHRLSLYKDYPVSKGCTSPFAPIWIAEMVNRQTAEKKAAR